MKNNKKLLVQLINEFYPYAKQRLGFQEECKIGFISDPENAKNPLGKTAQYDPESKKITLFIEERHPKDIMRSLSHELVHHNQNLNGQFDNNMNTEEGYAQKDPHLRNLEKEAFLVGNMIFRDFEDQKKKEIRESIYSKRRFKDMDWKDKLFEGRNMRLMGRLLHEQGLTIEEEEEQTLEEENEELEEACSGTHKRDEEELEEKCARKEKMEKLKEKLTKAITEILKKKVLNERIQFDPPAHQVDFDEPLDSQLIEDVREMLKAKEKREDIEQLLIRGEDMTLEEAWRYIKAAEKQGQE